MGKENYRPFVIWVTRTQDRGNVGQMSLFGEMFNPTSPGEGGTKYPDFFHLAISQIFNGNTIFKCLDFSQIYVTFMMTIKQTNWD